jgi:hypothetical protein
MKNEAAKTTVNGSGADEFRFANNSAPNSKRQKSISTSDKRHAARDIVRYSKTIFKLSTMLGLPNIQKLSEILFYEAYITAGGKVDLQRLEAEV